MITDVGPSSPTGTERSSCSRRAGQTALTSRSESLLPGTELGARSDPPLELPSNDVFWAHRDSRQLQAGCVTERVNDRWRRRERSQLTHAVDTVRRVRVGNLEHREAHRRHVEDRWDEVIGERRILDLAVHHLHLLEKGESEPLG